MTTYVVTYSIAHQGNREIGEYETMAEAEAAAYAAGAVGEPQHSAGERVYDVAGHEGDDAYGVWITAI